MQHLKMLLNIDNTCWQCLPYLPLCHNYIILLCIIVNKSLNFIINTLYKNISLTMKPCIINLSYCYLKCQVFTCIDVFQHFRSATKSEAVAESTQQSPQMGRKMKKMKMLSRRKGNWLLQLLRKRRKRRKRKWMLKWMLNINVRCVRNYIQARKRCGYIKHIHISALEK